MKTYKVKLMRDKDIKHLHGSINLAGSISNCMIARLRRFYRLSGKNPNWHMVSAHMTKMKHMNRFKHWNKLDAQAIQDIRDRIELAYKKFFIDIKMGRRAGLPKFKKVRLYKSFTLKQHGYKFIGHNTISIMGRRYKYHKSQEVEGKIKTITVKRDTIGDIYLFIVTDHEPETIARKPESMGKTVGIDFGLKTFLTLSNGDKIEALMPFKRALDDLKKAQLQLSSKQKGSNNRTKARLKVARLHKKVVNQRRDFHRKLARWFASNYEVVSVEDLNLRGMIANRSWASKMSDLAYGEFLKELEWQCYKHGTEFIKINRWEPSTKTCSICGHILSEKLSLDQRFWTCPQCDATHDRDINAAVNIDRVGASTLRGEGVRR